MSLDTKWWIEAYSMLKVGLICCCFSMKNTVKPVIWDYHVKRLTSAVDRYTTALRDQPLIRYHFVRNVGLHFYTFTPLMEDHLSYRTTFLVSWVVLIYRFHCICMKDITNMSSMQCRWCLHFRSATLAPSSVGRYTCTFIWYDFCDRRTADQTFSWRERVLVSPLGYFMNGVPYHKQFISPMPAS